jgi:hypothetical protein
MPNLPEQHEFRFMEGRRFASQRPASAKLGSRLVPYRVLETDAFLEMSNKEAWRLNSDWLLWLLSFGVFFLALGIPGTLLDCLASSDSLQAPILTASVLEGLSLPAFMYFSQQAIVHSAIEGTFSVEPAVFDLSFFRPPSG